MRKEIPLLSKLLLDNSIRAEDLMYRIKETGHLNGFDIQTSSSELHQQLINNQATKYSNINPDIIEPDGKKLIVREGLEGSKPRSQSQNIQNATELSNKRDNTQRATKFSSKDQLKNHNKLKKLPVGIKCPQQVTNGNIYHLKPNTGIPEGLEPKYYINNPSRLIKTASSGGVEAAQNKQRSHTIRLSISPSQGDDPGFKSRPEHS